MHGQTATKGETDRQTKPFLHFLQAFLFYVNLLRLNRELLFIGKRLKVLESEPLNRRCCSVSSFLCGCRVDVNWVDNKASALFLGLTLRIITD